MRRNSLDGLKETFYKNFDESMTVQNYIKQTEANNDDSVNKTAKKIVDHASGTLKEDIANVNAETGKLLQTLIDDYLTEEFVRQYVRASVKNQ